jgi:6-pyruvoyltetrahydropterin/6-carboxytetrahydropterin synthase
MSKAMIELTKTFGFSAAHYLPDHPKCGNIHGHNYKLEVRIRGEVNPETGMVIDFADLKNIVNESVMEKLDHKYLNDLVKNPEIEKNHLFKIPTAENIAMWIYEILQKKIPEIYQVRLWETEENSVIYPPRSV